MTHEDQQARRAELSHLLDVSTTGATTATLGSIVARARSRRDRRLKIVTGVSIVIALAGAGAAGISEATRAGTTSALPRTGRLAPRSTSSAWTKHRQSLGSAPTGLKWTQSSVAKGTGAAANAIVPSATAKSLPGADFCSEEGCGITFSNGFIGPLTKLFDRTSGDVTVRAFEESTPQVLPLSSGSTTTSPPASGSSPPQTTGNTPTGAPPVVPVCGVTQALVAEVSNPGAIGELTAPLPPADTVSGLSEPFEVIDSSVVGVPEGSPIEVIATHVGSNVSSVEASFSDGTTDEMAVVDGWAVVVDDGSAPLPATITALDSSGNTIGTAGVTDDAAIAEPTVCLLPLENNAHSGSATAQSTATSK